MYTDVYYIGKDGGYVGMYVKLCLFDLVMPNRMRILTKALSYNVTCDSRFNTIDTSINLI